MIVQRPKELDELNQKREELEAQIEAIDEELSAVCGTLASAVARVFNGHPRRVTIVTRDGAITAMAYDQRGRAVKIGEPWNINILYSDMISIEVLPL